MTGRWLVLLLLLATFGNVSQASEAGSLEPRIRALAGVRQPHDLVRHGNRLYVADDPWTGRKRISVIDVSKPGREDIVERIRPPVHPMSIAIARGNLYVVDDQGKRLYARSLKAGGWVKWPVAVPPTYGTPPQLYSTAYRLFIAHHNQIDVMDVRDHTVIGTIINDDPQTYAYRLSVSGSKVVVLGEACGFGASHYTVYRLSDLKRLYRRALDDYCPTSIEVSHGKVYVGSVDSSDVRKNQLVAYDLHDGTKLSSLAIPGLRRALAVPAGLLVDDFLGNVTMVDFDLGGVISGPTAIPTSELIWWPALLAIASAEDGRVFVSNLNDSTVAIVDYGGR